MDVREKLVELLDRFVDDDWYSSEEIAENLIANGVTVQECCRKAESVISKTGLMCTACHSDIDRDAVEVVRCKDCKYCRVASWGERFCARKQTDGVYAELSNLREDDFCSYGEKREEHQQDCTYNKNGHCMGQKLMPECDAKNCDRRK